MKQNKTGSTLVIILIITVLLALAGGATAYYFLVMKPASEQPAVPATKTSSPQVTAPKESLDTVSDVEKIEKELENTAIDDTSENLSATDFNGL